MAIDIFAMPSSSIILLLSAVFGVSNALPWAGPEPTSVHKESSWSPRTTAAPATPADLFKRASVDIRVCGWVGGNSANTALCKVGSSCVHDTSHGYVGCCATEGPCTAGVYTSCVDHKDKVWKSNPVFVNNGIYTCPGTLECYQNTYRDGFLQWACGDADGATTIETSYAGQPKDLRLQIVFTGVDFSATSVPPTTTSAPTSTPSQTASTAPANKSGLSQVAIAAAVVVPFCVLALLIGAFFLWRRRDARKKRYTPETGSLKGAYKRDSTSDSDSDPGPFPEMQQAQAPGSQPFSPEDYVSPMTERAHTVSPVDLSMLSPPIGYAGIQERLESSTDNQFLRPPNGDGAVSEIEHFSGAYMSAIGGMSPFSPQQSLQGGYMQNIPPQNSSGQQPGARTDMGMVTGVSAVAGANMKDAIIDTYADLEKETGGYKATPPNPRRESVEPFPSYDSRGFQVKTDGWTPRELKPVKRTPSGPNRYQLVDQPPAISEGAPVLHTPGQLRGKNGSGKSF